MSRWMNESDEERRSKEKTVHVTTNGRIIKVTNTREERAVEET